ncbi:SRPBCC family protein [Nocardioides conyzicola]|uniref:SRPBCC family protein n=1 Tax=Nocardioides conyzicola TaxID=1651781 RepID=A0ABP8Y1H9_9ACTN
MTSTASNVEVAAPVEVVWDLLADFAAISSWAGPVSQSSLLTETAPGPGAVRRVQVGRTALRETVVRWEPARALAYDITGLPAVVTAARNTWTLEPGGPGTLVTLSCDLETRGGPLVARIVARQVGKANAQLVQSLVAHLRSTHP